MVINRQQMYNQFSAKWDLGSRMTYKIMLQIENIPQLVVKNHLGWATGYENSILRGRIGLSANKVIEMRVYLMGLQFRLARQVYLEQGPMIFFTLIRILNVI